MKLNAKVRTCLGFNGNGHEAAIFYVSLLPDSRIENIVQPDPDSAPLVIELTLGAAPYMILNDGPPFTPSIAASISVLTEDQEGAFARKGETTGHALQTAGEGRCPLNPLTSPS